MEDSCDDGNDHDALIMEERQELMFTPKAIGGGGGSPTLRLGHFLKPSITSVDDQVSSLHPASFFPRKTDDADPKDSLSLKVSYRGWRYPQKNWSIWVDRMHSLHQSVWRKAGILNAVLNSTCIIPRDDKLVLGFAERWCFETNTFVFAWGEATITLEDMMVLGCYSVLGEPVSSPPETEEEEEIQRKLIKARQELNKSKVRKACQCKWMVKFMDSGSDIEHEAFLSLWLSRFVFPKGDETIAKNVLPIAIHLARGTKVALAPAVLSSIYRDLGSLRKAITAPKELREANKLVLLATLQLVQAWVWERFPTLRPKPHSIEHDEPRLARWNGLKRKDMDDVPSDMHSLAGRFHWRPYTRAVENLPLSEFYKEREEWIMADGLDEAFESFARCLRVSQLIGMDGYIDLYLPHRVAMQFGMDQDVPGMVERANSSCEIAWKNYSRPIRDAKLYIAPRLCESGITTRYLEWWNQLKFSCKDEGRPQMINVISSKSLKTASLMSPERLKASDNALVPPVFPSKCKRMRGTEANDDASVPPGFSRKCRSVRGTETDDNAFVPPGFPPSCKGVEGPESKKKALVPPGFTPKCNSAEGPELEANNNVFLPPDFPPKCKSAKGIGSDNEDSQRIAELMREIKVGKGKPSEEIQLPSSSSLIGDSENIQWLEEAAAMVVESVFNDEPACNGSEESNGNDTQRSRSSTIQNILNINLNKEEISLSTEHGIVELELEARISKLEKVISMVKTAKLSNKSPLGA